jgi:hypothetical protein
VTEQDEQRPDEAFDQHTEEEAFKDEYVRGHIRYWREHALELTRATIAFEHAALKPLAFLNGGALIAAMAFLGAIWDKAKQPNITLLYWCLGLWSIGLILSTVVAFLGYGSQFAFMKAARRKLDLLGTMATVRAKGDRIDEMGTLLEDAHAHILEESEQDKRGKRLRAWAVVCGLTSLAVFIVGVFIALYALRHVTYRV